MKVKVNVVCFVLGSEKNSNKKKNDSPKLQLLLNKDKIINFHYDGKDDLTKETIKTIKDITSSNNFFIDQVHTFGSNGILNILYIALLNQESIKTLKEEYKLSIFNNNIFEETEENMLIKSAFNYVKSKIDNTDIMYKLLPKTFTLEEVRLLYEYISGKNVDKSNFRKKIVNGLTLVNDTVSDKGFRPTRKYKKYE